MLGVSLDRMDWDYIILLVDSWDTVSIHTPFFLMPEMALGVFESLFWLCVSVSF